MSIISTGMQNYLSLRYFVSSFFFFQIQNRADKKRLNIIIVAEGAIDFHNKAITPDYIKDVRTKLFY